MHILVFGFVLLQCVPETPTEPDLCLALHVAKAEGKECLHRSSWPCWRAQTVLGQSPATAISLHRKSGLQSDLT